MASSFLLLNYFVGRKYRCETTKHKTVPKSYCSRRVRAPFGHQKNSLNTWKNKINGLENGLKKLKNVTKIVVD